MARTPTIQIELGFRAPDFTLPDVISGKKYNLSELKGKDGTAVFFICNHCPFVIDIIDELVKIPATSASFSKVTSSRSSLFLYFTPLFVVAIFIPFIILFVVVFLNPVIARSKATRQSQVTKKKTILVT